MIAAYNEDFNKRPQPSEKGTGTRPMFVFCLFIEGNGTSLLHLTYEGKAKEGETTLTVFKELSQSMMRKPMQ